MLSYIPIILNCLKMHKVVKTIIRSNTSSDRFQLFRRWLLYLVLSFFPVVCFSQANYLVTDSISSFGIRLVDGGIIQNMRVCQVRVDDEVIKYSPYEVLEYGFSDGRTFVSREIQISGSSFRTFLKVLHQEEFTLYYFRDRGIHTFFVEKDDTLLVELPRRDKDNNSFRVFLSELTQDCPEANQYIKFVNYSVQSLTRFAENYVDCDFRTFSFIRYGLSFGLGTSRLEPLNSENERLNYFNVEYANNFSVGLYLEVPMFLNNFFIQTELNFSRNSFSYVGYYENSTQDLLVNLTSFHVPLIIKYSYPSQKIRPFMNTGIFGSYYLMNETQHYEMTTGYSEIEITKRDGTLFLNNEQLGFLIGGGIEYRFNYRRSMMLELRYYHPFELKPSSSLGVTGFSLITKINI